jgi:type I restriction enzyme S subunit
MTSRTLIRVQYLTRVTAPQVDPKNFEEEEVAHYSIPSVQENAGPIVEKASSIDSNKLQLQGDEVLVSRLNPHKNTVVQVKRTSHPILCSTEFIPFEPTGIEPRFLCYSFQGQNSIQRFVAYASSATRSHARVDPSDIIKFKIPVFQPEEQSVIADYLDHETSRIDELIHEKEQMLELLAEKRAALVTQAVTRGQDSKVRLKPSGLDWLGEIPAHWREYRLKFVIDGIDQGFSPQCSTSPAEEGAWGVLKTGCVNGGVFNEEENKALPAEIDPPLDIEIHSGDVLMSRASGSVHLIGSVAMVERQPKARLLLSDKIYRIRTIPSLIRPDYFTKLLGAALLRHQIKAVISGAEGLANNIAKSDIKEFLLPVPPLSEQSSINETLNDHVAEMDNLVATLQQSVDLLRERRSAVITAAVTGQLSIEEMTP